MEFYALSQKTQKTLVRSKLKGQFSQGATKQRMFEYWRAVPIFIELYILWHFVLTLCEG